MAEYLLVGRASIRIAGRRLHARVCLGQEKAGAAAVGVLMVARLGEDRALASTRRYRDMRIESGAIGQRIYLAAESAGLSARNLAAFLDDNLNSLLGLDGQREAASTSRC